MLSAARRLALQPHARALSTRAPGSANLDWSNLGFTARDVNTYVCYNHKDGAWQGPTFSDDGYIKIHALSNALNYGQAVFEGLKVLQTRSGAVCAFNPAANHTRLQNSCKRLLMPDVPRELFFEGIETAVRKNADFVPPCGTGGSLYVRPLIFGHGAQLGLGAAPEFALIFAVCPVGAYYKGGLEGVDALVVSDYDRAAPLGVGHVKCAGNYAPDVLPSKLAKERGFSVCLYLDPQTRTFIEVRPRPPRRAAPRRRGRAALRPALTPARARARRRWLVFAGGRRSSPRPTSSA